MSASYDDWPAVVSNIQKALKKWARLSTVLGREGMDARTSGIFYLAVVQAVILFGSEMWVIFPRIGRMIGGFYHRRYSD